MKEVLTVVGAILLAVILLIAYNLYTNEKAREMYKLCLETRNEMTLTYCYPPR